ncbi:MAG: PD40 domain-containing protein, partial [Anaerolineales bacterium]|nr:PD40 domain-containing protein [Anaerolineales bacterium]
MERRSQWGWWMLGMALLLAAVGLIAAQPPAADAGAGIQLISRGLGGSPAAGDSRGVDMSGDGRYLVFESDAADLVPGDGNQATDIFLWDAQGGGISRLSAAPGGGDADGASHTPVISADGRFAAFESQATNLIGSDVNGVTSDIFLADRQTGAISLVTQSTGGVQANSSSFTPAISADGRYVAFASLARNLVISDTNLFIDIYVRDTVSNTLELVTRGLNGAMTDESSFTPAISADGRYVVYSSGASNLVPGDTNGVTDIFSYDRQTGETVRLSMGLNGAEANENSYLPDVSGDGRFVGYTSLATNLVLSDTNDAFDVFLFDRQTGQTERLSVTAQGDEANGNSVAVRLSFDGQYATYASDAANLAGGDNNGQMDIFWLDRGMGELQLVSRSVMGDAGNGQSVLSQLSNDGNMLAFESVASDLVGDDGNGSQDIFYTVVESMPPTPTPSPTATATVPVDLPQFLPLVRAGYPPSYEISGFVRTAAGQPVANVRVTTGAGRVAQTDASGAYRFQWL